MEVQNFEVFKFRENVYTKFINNKKEYLLNKNPYLDIVLTDYCNANCNFCIGDLVNKKETLNITIAKEKILFAIDNMHVNEVLLLGGEPTVNKNLTEYIGWLSSLNRLDKICMTSNGIKLVSDHMYLDEVMGSGLTHINISFMNIDLKKQSEVTSRYLTIEAIQDIYIAAKKYNVKLRINNNIFKGNNDTIEKIVHFYNMCSYCCDSIKFSPILPVDDFSVSNTKTKWSKENLLHDNKLEYLFDRIERHYSFVNEVSIITNNNQFGFVKNSLIPLKTPIVLNWNFGKYTGMMEKVIKENKINNLKLLANGELSLSWNKHLPEYFIKT